MKRLLEVNTNTPKDFLDAFHKRLGKPVDELEIRRWTQLVKNYKGGRLVDIGCLDSLVPIMAKKLHPRSEVWGLDNVPEVIDQLNHESNGVLYTFGDCYNTKFQSSYFDYVVAGELIEHLEDPNKFLVEAFRILKSGGILALSTPELEENEPGAVDGAKHIWSYSKQDIRDMLQFHCKKVVVKTVGSRLFPYKYSWPVIIAFGWKR